MRVSAWEQSPQSRTESPTPKFDTRYDAYGRGVVFPHRRISADDTISLSEAERRGRVSKAQVQHT